MKSKEKLKEGHYLKIVLENVTGATVPMEEVKYLKYEREEVENYYEKCTIVLTEKGANTIVDDYDDDPITLKDRIKQCNDVVFVGEVYIDEEDIEDYLSKFYFRWADDDNPFGENSNGYADETGEGHFIFGSEYMG